MLDGPSALASVQLLARREEPVGQPRIAFERSAQPCYVDDVDADANLVQAAATATETLCPPNPKELESATWNFSGRALFGTTSSSMRGSGVS